MENNILFKNLMGNTLIIK